MPRVTEVKKLVNDVNPKKRSRPHGKQARILRDTIDGITNPVIKRLAQKAGVKSMSSLVYSEVRTILNKRLGEVLQNLAKIVRSGDRAVVTASDVKETLQFMGNTVYATGKEGDMKKCAGHTSSNGKGALNAVRFYQKQHDCLYIPHTSFLRVVKEVMQDIDEVKWSPDAVGLLQVIMETFLVELFQDALLCAIHAKRETLYPKDILLVLSLRK